jgi:putative hemolysin
MDALFIGQLILLVALLALSAFFSGSETALFSLSSTKLKNWKESGTPKQRSTARLMDDHHATLVAILLGTNCVNIMTAILFSRLTERYVEGSAGPVVAGLLVTVLLLVFGEVTPKTIAYSKAQPIAVAVAGPIRLCRTLMGPLIGVLKAVSSHILAWLGPDDRVAAMSPEELQTFVAQGQLVGAFSPAEARMLNETFQLRETLTRSVMVPRTDVLTVDVSCDPATLLEHIRDYCHRRVPVIDGDLDDAVGILDVKRFLRAEPAQRERWTEHCVAPPVFIPELTSLDKALKVLREARRGMCLVVDEYGGIAGAITVEDIFEEILGELSDEYDQPTWEVTLIDSGHWRLSGLIPLADLLDRLPVELPETSADTLSGLITEHLDDMPEVGHSVSIGRYRFNVIEVNRRRIGTVDLIDTLAKEADES